MKIENKNTIFSNQTDTYFLWLLSENL